MGSSDKKKAAKKKKHSTPAGEFRHADGDRRRHSMGKVIRDALKRKELLKQIGAVESSDDTDPTEERE